MPYEKNHGQRQTLAVGNNARIDYRDGSVYISVEGVTVQISPESFFDLAGTTMLAYRNYNDFSGR